MNFRILPYFYLFFLFSPFLLLAQEAYDATTNDNFLKHYRQGEDAFNEKAFKKAERAFKDAIQLKPDFAATYRRLGLVYEAQHVYNQAAELYDQCIELSPSLSRTLYFQSGDMHLKTGNYSKASERFKAYESYCNLPASSFSDGEKELATDAYFQSLLPKYLQDSQFALAATTFDSVSIQNLGPNINSEVDDCFPYLANDESWMFYTRMGRRRAVDENLLYSAATNGAWTKGKRLGDVINSKVNEGMGKATRDERLMYFPACNREDILGVCDIFMAAMEKGKILDVQSLVGGVNSDKWDSQPSINCDGQALYFVSDRPGGIGGTDIWRSFKLDDGTWGNAINLGPTINTPDDEEAPFIADDGVTLYFASNGHPGYGDQDIFFSRRRADGSWGKPQNLGQPINSPRRELSFFMNAKGNKGYIASNREGGFGGLDIYEFQLPKRKDFEEIAYVRARVINAETGEGVATRVAIKDKGFYETDEAGRFFICYPTLSKLPVSIDEKSYYPYRKNHSLKEWNTDAYVDVEILLQPLNDAAVLVNNTKVVKIKPPKEEIAVTPTEIQFEERESRQLYTTSDIYFYFDQYKLTKEAQYNLDRLIQDIDPDQLALIVVEGYADNIGADDYNQKLSEKRAGEVATYFKSKGLSKLKVTYKGYGETRTSLINSKNRRVDIVVYYKM